MIDWSVLYLCRVVKTWFFQFFSRNDTGGLSNQAQTLDDLISLLRSFKCQVSVWAVSLMVWSVFHSWPPFPSLPPSPLLPLHSCQPHSLVLMCWRRLRSLSKMTLGCIPALIIKLSQGEGGSVMAAAAALIRENITASPLLYLLLRPFDSLLLLCNLFFFFSFKWGSIKISFISGISGVHNYVAVVKKSDPSAISEYRVKSARVSWTSIYL